MWQIGRVAAEAGVNVQTLRYYERRGLLARPARAPSGFRLYGPDAVATIRFIKRAQELGFSLAETEELLRLKDDRRSPCAEVRAAARAKIEEIDGKLKTLRAMKRALALLERTCARQGTARRCPILEAIGFPVGGRT